MDRRTLLLLGGAAAVALGAAFALTPGGDAPVPPRTSDGSAAAGAPALAFPGLADRLAGATRIEVRKPDATLALDRRGETWVLPEKGGYPARPEKVRELLVGLTELRLTEPRTADPEQLARLGLDDPAKAGSTALLLRVLDRTGAPIAELVVGRRRMRTQGGVPESVYVRRPAEGQSWLAEGRLPVDADPQLWLDRDVANIPADRVRRLYARRAGDAPPVLLAREDGGETRLAVREPPGLEHVDAIALDEVTRAFEYLTFLDVRRAAETPGAPLGEARVGLTEGLSVLVEPHRHGDELWIRLRALGDTPEAARLNARWDGWAYQVGQWKEKALLPRPEDLRERERGRPAQPDGSGGGAPAPAPATQ